MKIYRDLKKYSGYINFAIRAGLKSEVSGSYLNWIWWILEPFCFMIIYATIFGMIFESSEENFPLFIFIGNAMWSFFSKCIGCSTTLIKQNETIISKVYVPKFVLLLVEMGINSFKLLLNFGVVAIMLLFFRVPFSGYLLLSVLVFAVFFLITFAFSTLLMHCGVYVEDLSYVISILLNMLMFFSGVFYSVETRLDAPFGAIVGIFNPVAFLMTSMRKAIMYHQCPDIPLLLVWTAVGLILSFMGIRILYKNENNYAKVI